jgi:hypothetical protein
MPARWPTVGTSVRRRVSRRSGRGPARGVASIGTMFASQTAEVAASMRAHYDRLSARYLADGWLHLPACAVVGSGAVVG